MSVSKKTSKQIEDYVIAHVNDRPRANVARHCGICMSTLYRIIRQHNGEMRYELANKHPGIEDTIRKLWPIMSASEIAKATGISKSVVICWKNKLGVEHTSETKARLKEQRNEKFRLAKLTTDRSKMTEAWKHTRRMDEWRVMGGMKQKTKFRISVIPQRICRVLWYLGKRYNYFYESNMAVAYFDSQTTRAKNEDYFTKKYGIRFERADE